MAMNVETDGICIAAYCLASPDRCPRYLFHHHVYTVVLIFLIQPHYCSHIASLRRCCLEVMWTTICIVHHILHMNAILLYSTSSFMLFFIIVFFNAHFAKFAYKP